MPPEAEPPRAHRTLDKSRMESFSDGVFGFAITLLAVNLAIHPPGATPCGASQWLWLTTRLVTRSAK